MVLLITVLKVVWSQAFPSKANQNYWVTDRLRNTHKQTTGTSAVTNTKYQKHFCYYYQIFRNVFPHSHLVDLPSWSLSSHLNATQIKYIKIHTLRFTRVCGILQRCSKQATLGQRVRVGGYCLCVSLRVVFTQISNFEKRLIREVLCHCCWKAVSCKSQWQARSILGVLRTLYDRDVVRRV